MQQESPVLYARDLLRGSGLAPLQVQDAGYGHNHHLFVVEIDNGPLRLLRVPRSGDEKQISDWLRSEVEAMRRAHNIVPVPHPSRLLPDSEHPRGTLMPIVPGVRASDLRREGLQSPQIARLCRELATVLGKLHQIEYPIHEPTSIPFLTPGFLTGGERLLHGDAHLGNLMVEKTDEGWDVTGMIDWSFCHWGPPESDLVEMAITEAEPRPPLGHAFFEAYLEAGGMEPREHVFKWSLIRELERRLGAHAQAYETTPRDVWTRWLDQLHRPGSRALRVFDGGRMPGGDLV